VIVGLRVDVDTLRGTQLGVPRLRALLARQGVRASFFFSVGPDNMGRHLRRLVRPTFFAKMLRTRAASLYGWSVLFRGTLWPGPRIGIRCREEILEIAKQGHETGLHAWDHHAWQTHLERWDSDRIRREIERGFEELAQIVGRAPESSATPGWRTDDRVLLEKERLPFLYNSDCRGDRIFLPVVGGVPLSHPQIPVTLPTYDEALGRDCESDETYNEWLIDRMAPDGLNVLAVHAEVEGIARADLFADFLRRARAQGIRFAPLGSLIDPGVRYPLAHIEARSIPGREGWVACEGARREVPSGR
jgi:undecaprenyl phosphate-alpha-L-ara4FN deformylase